MLIPVIMRALFVSLGAFLIGWPWLAYLILFLVSLQVILVICAPMIFAGAYAFGTAHAKAKVAHAKAIGKQMAQAILAERAKSAHARAVMPPADGRESK
jgi:hypothetical protein